MKKFVKILGCICAIFMIVSLKVVVMAVFVLVTGLNVYKAQTEVELSDTQLKNVEALANNEYGVCAEWITKNCYERFTERHGTDYYATCSETILGGIGECAALESKIPDTDPVQCLHCIRYY